MTAIVVFYFIQSLSGMIKFSLLSFAESQSGVNVLDYSAYTCHIKIRILFSSIARSVIPL